MPSAATDVVHGDRAVLFGGHSTASYIPSYSKAGTATNGKATFGNLVLINQSTSVIHLESIELVDADPGLRLLGVRTQNLGPDDRDLVGLVKGFPVEDYEQGDPVDGTVIEPEATGHTTQVILGLQTSTPDARFEGLEVRYAWREGHFRTTIPVTVGFCPGDTCADREG